MPKATALVAHLSPPHLVLSAQLSYSAPSFPGDRSRATRCPPKSLRWLFCCAKAQVSSPPSSSPITLLAPIASSLSSLPVSLPPFRSQCQPGRASCQLFTLQPEVPEAQNISFELTEKKKKKKAKRNTIPPHSNLHVSILAEVFRLDSEL